MTRRSDTLSLAEARRIAIAAQGLHRPRREAAASKRDLARLVDRLGVLQIDSVNVVARAHTLPGFSRLGPYDTGDLDRLAYDGRRRRLFEYWGHEASYLPVALQPLFRWRMAAAARGEGLYGGLARFGREKAAFIESVHREVETRGPMAAGDLPGGEKGAGGWWGWSDGKSALEWLFWAGIVTTATRRGNFERVYDLTERVLPRAILDTPTPAPDEAKRGLMRLAAAALGIASERCLRDYYRLGPAEGRAAIAALVEAGELTAVRVAGWDKPAYLWHGAARPRRAAGQALLAPFDPLVWQRERVEALFGLRIRLEIYTPAHKRQHGYYVLPFLLGERIAARLDLKADRQANVLRVLAAHGEPGADPGETATALAAELALMAGWLGLGGISVAERGDLAPALRRLGGS